MKKKFDHDTFAKVFCIIFALALMVLITGCAAKPKTQEPGPFAVIKNAKNIGQALGCVFGGCDKQPKDQQ